MPARHQRYRGSKWLVRIASTLVVLAVALLSGAVIGGVGVYIFTDFTDASGPPRSGGATASKPSAPAINAESKTERLLRRPARVTDKLVGTAAPPLPLPPAGAHPDDVSSSQAAAAAAPPAQARPAAAPQATAADELQQNSAGAAAEKTSSDEKDASPAASPARTATNSQIARKAASARKRAAIASMRRLTAEARGEREAAAQRPVYDYYRRDDRGRQDSAQSFFGFFGQNRYGDRYNDRYSARGNGW